MPHISNFLQFREKIHLISNITNIYIISSVNIFGEYFNVKERLSSFKANWNGI